MSAWTAPVQLFLAFLILAARPRARSASWPRSPWSPLRRRRRGSRASCQPCVRRPRCEHRASRKRPSRPCSPGAQRAQQVRQARQVRRASVPGRGRSGPGRARERETEIACRNLHRRRGSASSGMPTARGRRVFQPASASSTNARTAGGSARPSAASCPSGLIFAQVFCTMATTCSLLCLPAKSSA